MRWATLMALGALTACSSPIPYAGQESGYDAGPRGDGGVVIVDPTEVSRHDGIMAAGSSSSGTGQIAPDASVPSEPGWHCVTGEYDVLAGPGRGAEIHASIGDHWTFEGNVLTTRAGEVVVFTCSRGEITFPEPFANPSLRWRATPDAPQCVVLTSNGHPATIIDLYGPY